MYCDNIITQRIVAYVLQLITLQFTTCEDKSLIRGVTTGCEYLNDSVNK